jgi:hypothetical protein
MTSIGSIDEGEDESVAQAHRKGFAFRTPIARVFMQQHRSREASNAFSSVARKTIAIGTSKCFSSAMPFRRVLARRVRHVNSCVESVLEKAARAELRLHQILEFFSDGYVPSELTIG